MTKLTYPTTATIVRNMKEHIVGPDTVLEYPGPVAFSWRCDYCKRCVAGDLKECPGCGAPNDKETE